MASFYGMGGANSNFYSNLFGSSNSQSSPGLSLGDYALIQKGTYKKLMKNYFSKDNEKKSDDKKTEGTDNKLTEEEKKIQKGLLETKGAAADLSKAAKAVQGLDTTDMEAATKKVQTFVDAYNKTIDKTGDVDSRSVLQKTVFMVGNTKSQKKVLGNLGITIGANNKLSFDKEIFKKAEQSAVNSVFAGYNSFAGKISSKANEITNLSKDAVNKMVNRGAYNNRGKVDTLDTNSLYNSLF